MDIWSQGTVGPPCIFVPYIHSVPGIFGSHLSVGTRCVETICSSGPSVVAPVDRGTGPQQVLAATLTLS